MPGDDMAAGFTVKDIVLETQKAVHELAGKVDTYVAAHEVRHAAEQDRIAVAHAEPAATAAGRSVVSDLDAVAAAGRDTRTVVDRHDVLIQRLIGAFGLVMLALSVAGTLIAIHGRIP